MRPTLALLFLSGFLYAQAPKPDPDVLVFTNDDKLAGHFVRSTGGSVTFHSDMLGDLQIDWSKIKELHTAQKVAVIQKGIKVKKASESSVPQGTVAVTDQKIEVGSTPPQSIPVGNAAYVVTEDEFQKAILHNPGFLEDWNGAITGAASFVQATQDSRNYNLAINLIRAIPTENWLDARNRTTLNFSDTYGKVSQPGTPDVKTSIYHAGAERDQYFSPRLYGFGQAAFDHNFSQGLDLQQSYGGGIGWTAIKSANQTLDLKGSAGYERQQFVTSATTQSLIASTFSEIYLRKLPRGMTLNENLTFIPAWNNTKAYSAIAGAGLVLPVYKRFSASLTTVDNYLNDPPAGFKKNSYQFNAGISYSLR